MGVESAGPDGYDRQYAGTVLYFLAHADILRSLVVEPDDGEDAEAQIIVSGDAWTVEIQAKSGADVDFSLICHCLQHFPPRQAQGALIERLRQDSKRLLVLLSTGRCVDQARRFAKPLVDACKPSGATNVAQVDVDTFMCALADARPKGSGTLTNLKVLRRQSRTSTLLSQTEVYEISSRILVVEQLDEVRINDDAERMLVRAGVPRSQVQDAFREMVQHVRDIRSQRGDALPRLRQALTQRQGMRAFADPIHVERPEERQLLRVAELQHVVLITGHAHCGKTHLARRLAQALQDRGFEYGRSSELRQAMEFLNAPTPADRVFLLEDPFDLGEGAVVQRQLSRMVIELPAHRILIATSREDALPGGRGAAAIDGHHWTDVTLRDTELAVQIWNCHAAVASVPEVARDRFVQQIRGMDEAHVFQPGQLRYLARNFIADATPEHLARLARVNSDEVAKQMVAVGEAAISLMSLLALVSNAIDPISNLDLAFVLSDKEEEPGLLKGDARVLTLGGPATEPTYPRYSIQPALPTDVRDLLTKFELVGWIRCEARGVVFAHPDYHEAAWRAAALLLPTQRQALLRGVQRTVASLAARSSLGAIRQFGRAAEVWPDEEEQNRLDVVALTALKSIFPSVRDAAVLFLLPRVNRLSRSDYSVVETRVTEDGVSGEEVAWHEGRPFIPQQLEGFSAVRRRLHNARTAELQAVETAEGVWLALQQQPSPEALRRGLLADEVFIRTLSARLFCRDLGPDSREVLERILEDHPRVVVGALRGLFDSWPTLQGATRTLALASFRAVLQRSTIAWAAAPLMWRMYHYVGNDLAAAGQRWHLWGELYPTILSRAPNQRYRADQVCHTAREARAHISAQARIAVAESWLAWIMRKLASELPPGDALSVADYIVSALPVGSPERETSIRATLETVDTGFTMVSMRSYVQVWSQLTDSEQAMVRALLASDRVDIEWLRAVVLTTDNAPDELIAEILGRGDALRLEPADILAVLPPALLSCCVRTHQGSPQPLWWLGLQFDARPGVWDDVCRSLRQEPSALLFAEVWSSALGNPSVIILNEWKMLCWKASESHLNSIFEILLRATREVNSSFREYWQAIWERADTLQTERWADEIAAQAEGFFYHTTPDKVPVPILNALLSRLPSDRCALTIMEMMDALPGQGQSVEAENFRNAINTLYSTPEALPRLAFICEALANACQALGAKEAMDRVRDGRSAVIQRGSAQAASTQNTQVDTPDWVYAHQRATQR